MHELHDYWFLEPPHDLEQKQYVLLSYKQFVENEFKHFRIYPHAKNLLMLSNFMGMYKRKKDSAYTEFLIFIQRHVPSKRTDIHNDVPDMYVSETKNKISQHISKIIEWSEPILNKLIQEGSLLWEGISEYITIEYVGDTSKVSKYNGYILLAFPDTASLEIYSFKIDPSIKDSDSAITMKRTGTVKRVNNNDNPFIPNFNKAMQMFIDKQSITDPTLFIGVTCDIDFPRKESLLPILKDEIIQHMKQRPIY